MSSDVETVLLRQKIKNRIAWLSRAKIAFYILPPLMLMVVLGTIAQRFIGLYEAQQIFFSSFILWVGFVPLPGTMSLLLLLNISLTLKFVCHSKWSWPKSGINLAHLGVLVIFIGGFLTILNAEEGYLQVAEGGASNIIRDYHEKSLTVTEDDKTVLVVSDKHLKSGKSIAGELPFTISVLASCRNCDVVPEQKDDAVYHGLAKEAKLVGKRLAVQDEENLSGITFKVSGTSSDQDGIYALMDTGTDPIRIEKDGRVFQIEYGKTYRRLPFAVMLEDFERNNYPGTEKARSYSSDIIVIDGEIHWPVRIEMNAPLRYKGYTLFQSSFTENGKKEETILAVVKNSGWLFPYVGALITAFGLILHVIIVLRRQIA